MHNRPDDPKLVFGLGATKSGTTWLSRYLLWHKDCSFRTVKELHYFNATRASWDAQIKNLTHIRARLNADLQTRAQMQDQGEQWRLKRRIKDIDDLLPLYRASGIDTAAYLKYISARAGPGQLIGDITPAYALLPQTMLARMHDLSINTRFIFLMRDPVARFWSHVRMLARREASAPEQMRIKALEICDQALSGERDGLLRRGDYPEIIPRILQVIPASRIFVGFMEDMMTNAGLRQICDFLDIGFRPGKFENTFNKGRSVKLPDDMHQGLSEFFKSHYSFAQSHMGYLPRNWQENMVRG